MFQLVPVQGGNWPQEGKKGRNDMYPEFTAAMNARTVARHLGASEAWVRAAIARGDLGAFHVGRKIMVSKSQLIDFMEGGGSTCKMRP